VFPVRYELNSYISFRRNPVFTGLSVCHIITICALTSIFSLLKNSASQSDNEAPDDGAPGPRFAVLTV
jgi:hypothetical protein